MSFGEEVMPNMVFQDRTDDLNIEVKQLGVGNPARLSCFRKYNR